jgi:hypothetical protein
MSGALKYMVDEKGDKTSVLVPLKTWQRINQENINLQKKIQVLMGIQAGLIAIKAASRSGKKLPTLNNFLRESNS